MSIQLIMCQKTLKWMCRSKFGYFFVCIWHVDTCTGEIENTNHWWIWGSASDALNSSRSNFMQLWEKMAKIIGQRYNFMLAPLWNPGPATATSSSNFCSLKRNSSFCERYRTLPTFTINRVSYLIRCFARWVRQNLWCTSVSNPKKGRQPLIRPNVPENCMEIGSRKEGLSSENKIPEIM